MMEAIIVIVVAVGIYFWLIKGQEAKNEQWRREREARDKRDTP